MDATIMRSGGDDYHGDGMHLAWMSELRAMVAEQTGELDGGRLTAGGAAAASLMVNYA